MKIWIKYLLGIILGIVAFNVFPLAGINADDFAAQAAEFAVRFGRYTLLPVLFFGTASAVYKIRSEKIVLKTALWTGASIVLSSLILAALGLISVLIVKLPRIPITGEETTQVASINLKDLLFRVFPFSGFDCVRDGVYLLPCFVFAGFAGAGCASNQINSKPLASFFESAASVSYSVMSFFIEWFSVGMIAVCWNRMILSKEALADAAFLPIFITLLVDFFIVTIIIYPLILRFLCNDTRPYNVIFASICPVLAAFFCEDSNLSLLVNLRHGRESLGIEQQTSDVTFPLFSIFARGGSALVTSVCFVVILRSYSSLGFTVNDILWIFLSSFAVSFVLGAIPTGGTFVALTVLCSFYGRGFESSYLLLQKAFPILCSFSAAFDAVSAMFASYVAAVKTKTFNRIELRHFI